MATPPGTISKSSGGASSYVCVGTISWLKAEPMLLGLVSRTETGSSDEAMTERFIVTLLASRLKAWSGPKTSRASKPGKAITPMLVGTLESSEALYETTRLATGLSKRGFTMTYMYDFANHFAV